MTVYEKLLASNGFNENGKAVSRFEKAKMAKTCASVIFQDVADMVPAEDRENFERWIFVSGAIVGYTSEMRVTFKQNNNAYSKYSRAASKWMKVTTDMDWADVVKTASEKLIEVYTICREENTEQVNRMVGYSKSDDVMKRLGLEYYNSYSDEKSDINVTDRRLGALRLQPGDISISHRAKKTDFASVVLELKLTTSLRDDEKSRAKLERIISMLEELNS